MSTANAVVEGRVVAVQGVPLGFTAPDLRYFFSDFIERDLVECFHYTHGLHQRQPSSSSPLSSQSSSSSSSSPPSQPPPPPSTSSSSVSSRGTNASTCLVRLRRRAAPADPAAPTALVSPTAEFIARYHNRPWKSKLPFKPAFHNPTHACAFLSVVQPPEAPGQAAAPSIQCAAGGPAGSDVPAAPSTGLGDNTRGRDRRVRLRDFRDVAFGARGKAATTRGRRRTVGTSAQVLRDFFLPRKHEAPAAFATRGEQRQQKQQQQQQQHRRATPSQRTPPSGDAPASTTSSDTNGAQLSAGARFAAVESGITKGHPACGGGRSGGDAACGNAAKVAAGAWYTDMYGAVVSLGPLPSLRLHADFAVPPELGQGNVGTPTRVLEVAINRCALRVSTLRLLGASVNYDFRRSTRHPYAEVPFEYPAAAASSSSAAAAAPAASGDRGAATCAAATSVATHSSAPTAGGSGNSGGGHPSDGCCGVSGGGHGGGSGGGSLGSMSITTRTTGNKRTQRPTHLVRHAMPARQTAAAAAAADCDGGGGSSDADDGDGGRDAYGDDHGEEWDRHNALHGVDEAYGFKYRTHTQARDAVVFEDTEAVDGSLGGHIWDKGDASGLVFYTDDVYWESNAVKGDFDERNTDDWDVDYGSAGVGGASADPPHATRGGDGGNAHEQASEAAAGPSSTLSSSSPSSSGPLPPPSTSTRVATARGRSKRRVDAFDTYCARGFGGKYLRRYGWVSDSERLALARRRQQQRQPQQRPGQHGQQGSGNDSDTNGGPSGAGGSSADGAGVAFTPSPWTREAAKNARGAAPSRAAARHGLGFDGNVKRQRRHGGGAARADRHWGGHGGSRRQEHLALPRRAGEQDTAPGGGGGRARWWSAAGSRALERQAVRAATPAVAPGPRSDATVAVDYRSARRRREREAGNPFPIGSIFDDD